MFPITFLHTRKFYWLMSAFIVLSSLLLVLFVATPKVVSQKFTFNPQNSYQCSTGNSNSSDSFKILSVTFSASVSIADALCKESEIIASYGQVEISWMPRKESIEKVYLNSRDIDLVLFSRDYIVAALTAPNKTRYLPIAQVEPKEGSHTYFWSMDSGFKPTREYLAGKKIGLLNHTASESQYKTPLANLTSIDMGQDTYEIDLFESVIELRQTFMHGRLDLIVAAHAPEKDLGITAVSLGETTYAFFYIVDKLIETSIPCSVIDTLSELLPRIGIKYIQAIKPVNQVCDESL